MATVSTDVSQGRGFLAFLSRTGEAVLSGLVGIAESYPRAKELERLSALSDAELAKRGLERSRLFEHVFRGAGIL